MHVLKYLRNQWDRVGAWACITLGVVLLVSGWLGVSNALYPAEQNPYIISAGLGGIFSLGLGAMLWLSADLTDEWRKLDAIERYLHGTGHLPEPLPSNGSESAAKAPAGIGLVPADPSGRGRR